MSPIISVENLGKSYLVGHQSANTERYTALRDVLGRSVKNFGRKAWDMARGRQMIQGDEVEEFWALKDVSFEVNEGEVVGIIGRNGAGKSTLLKILSRITEPTNGRVTLRGRVASLLEVGTGFHPELTGRENVFLNGAILGMTRSEIQRKFDDIVDFAGVEKFLDTPVKRYSSGMYVRLAFAVAAHLDPEILIVDEVLAVGDSEFQKKCMGKMKDVAACGRTVLFVSHNMSAVSALCSGGMLLSKGKVIATGNVSKVLTAYTNSVEERYDLTLNRDLTKPKITRVRIERDSLAKGDLEIAIDFLSPTPLKTPIGGVVLRALSGEPVWGSNGRYHSRTDSTETLYSGTLACRACKVPLQPGQYLLSVWLADWHTDHDSLIDQICITFKGASAESLRPSPAVVGHLDWDANWTVSRTNNTS